MPEPITYHKTPEAPPVTTGKEAIVYRLPEQALSPEVEDLLERTPSRFTRMGLFAVVAALGMLLLVAILVKYPDILEGNVTLTTNPLPIRAKAQSGGRVLQVFAKEGQQVTEGEVLAEIENPIGLKKINELEQLCTSINRWLHNDVTDSLAVCLKDDGRLLGDAQADYNKLVQNINAYLLVKDQHIYHKRMTNLRIQGSRYTALSKSADQERALVKRELESAEDFFEAKKKLYEERVLSRKEFNDEVTALNEKRLALENQLETKIRSGIAEGDNNKLLLDLEYEKKERENELVLSIEEQVRNVQSYIRSWRLKFLVTAPFNGRVYELRSLQRNEVVAAGEELYMVAPDHFKYVAYSMIPAASFGKIATGQPAHIMLAQFPYNEYGYLEGKVSFISHTPQAADNTKQGEKSEAMYRVHIQLPDSLYTTYHIGIRFSPEMTGNIRIITRDKNLLQRLLDNIARIDK